jgi:hypothetical protein
MEELGGEKWMLVALDNVDERLVIANDSDMSRQWHVAVFEEAEEESEKR